MNTPLRPKPTIIDFDKIALFADNTESGQRASLQFGARDGYPRITVFLRNKENTIIQGPMELNSLCFFISKFREILQKNIEDQCNMVLKVTEYEDNKPTENLKAISKLSFGKDENGIAWIMLVGHDTQKIKFEFTPGKFCVVTKKDGTNCTISEMSSLIALNFLNILEQTYSTYNIFNNFKFRSSLFNVSQNSDKKSNNDLIEKMFNTDNLEITSVSSF